MARKRLVRPRQGRKIAGVCLGLAEYFDIDVTLLRIVWLLCSLFGLVGIIAYAVSWVVMPEEPFMLSAPAGEPQSASRV